MALTPSTMLDLGTPMPSFRLHNFDGVTVSSGEFRNAPGLLVAFICAHCPFVKHIRQGFAAFARDCQSKGLAIIAINSNDISISPADGPAEMKKEAAEAGYVFPYLFDEDQSVARAFRAACTPDFFLFDRSGKLAYRGQFDASRPGNEVPVTGLDLRNAADAVLSGRAAATDQLPSIGCNIKWKPGSEPNY